MNDCIAIFAAVFGRELRKYINYYNRYRIKLKLNGKSPV